jgi:hypothetical protein
MNILGVRLNLLIGREPFAAPAPPSVLEALADVEVTHSDRERSGFRLTFAIGRSGPLDFLDFDLVGSPLLQEKSRVVLTVLFNITPRVIMDGIVTRRDLVPGDAPGEARLVLSGHDLSLVLDREHKTVEHPAQDETVIVNKIAGSYARYGLVPKVVPPTVIDPPIPIERTPQQACTDWGYLQRMAKRFGYVTYVEPGPAPLTNTLYWGPPVRPDLPQKPLNVNLGPITNVINVSAAADALATTLVETKVKDPRTGQDVPVLAAFSTRPPLGLLQTALLDLGSLRKVRMPTSGLSPTRAMAWAQGLLDASTDDSITVSGTLDSVKYNDVLRAGRHVDLRGVGFQFDGTYLTRSVTHQVTRGAYTQDFSLSRAELGARSPLVAQPGVS